VLISTVEEKRMQNVSLRSFAFYRSQFHPIPEHDLWYGKGFTDWTEVAAAKPLFEGHAQPRLPGDLGFYDLRLSEAREAQAALARQHGIDGFVYSHYWFDGRRILERPFDEVLRSQAPDFPFALCWMNEDVTRDGTVLIPQTYSEADDRNHMQWVAQAMLDRRYIRIDGKPVFVVNDVTALPNPSHTAEIWREEARNAGVGEIYLLCCNDDRSAANPVAAGFDAAIDCVPQNIPTDGVTKDEYLDVAAAALSKSTQTHRVYPCVTPGYDNTPSAGVNAYILTDNVPDLYKGWVAATIQREVSRGHNDVVLFVNAWNHWAQGAILEPCATWGTAYLEAHAAGVAQGLRPAQASAVTTATVADEQGVNTTPQNYVPQAPTQTAVPQPSPAIPTTNHIVPTQPTQPIGGSTMSRTGLTVAIVTNGDAEALMSTLRAALDTCQGMGTIDFLVVDNATQDETPLLLDALKGDIRSIRTETQLPANAAWMLAKQASQGEYVLLLSNDVTLTSGWLEPVITSLVMDPTCNAVCPGQSLNGQVFPSQPLTSTSGVCLLVREFTDVTDIAEAKYVPESVVDFTIPQTVAR
jgi:hypothetical protein